MRDKITTLLLLGLMFIFAFDQQNAKAFYYNNAKDSLTRIKVSTQASHTLSFDLSNNEIMSNGNNLLINFKKTGEGFILSNTNTTADFDFNDGIERKIVSTDGSCRLLSDGLTTEDLENDIAVSVDQSTGILAFIPCQYYRPSNPNARINIIYGSNAIVDGLGIDRVNNPSIAGTYLINIGKNGIEGTNIAVIIIPDDQISVVGTVDPAISILISSNRTLGFGEVTSNSVRYATTDGTGSASEPGMGQPISISAGTNGQGGITLYMHDKGDGATSGLWLCNEKVNEECVINELIPAAPAHQVVDDSKLFTVYGKNSTGLVINPIFDNLESNGEEAITTIPKMLAQNNNPFASGSLDLVFKAATNNTTKAGKYVDTITILCTAIY